MYYSGYALALSAEIHTMQGGCRYLSINRVCIEYVDIQVPITWCQEGGISKSVNAKYFENGHTEMAVKVFLTRLKLALTPIVTELYTTLSSFVRCF